MVESMRRTACAVLAVLGLMVAGCTGNDDESDVGGPQPLNGPAATGTAPDPAACADGKTRTEGRLTVATGDPTFPPYVIDDDPESGQGFEAAVAYAVAAELGFSHDDVDWVRTRFVAAFRPGPKEYDFNIQQYSITPRRSKV